MAAIRSPTTTVTTVRILPHLSMTSSFWARDVCAVVSVPCMTCKLSSSFLAIPCRQRNRASTTSDRTIQTITNGRKLINDLQIRLLTANLEVVYEFFSVSYSLERSSAGCAGSVPLAARDRQKRGRQFACHARYAHHGADIPGPKTRCHRQMGQDPDGGHRRCRTSDRCRLYLWAVRRQAFRGSLAA